MFGADVIKVERPALAILRAAIAGRAQCRQLYFTMLNHNKRSITLDTRNPKGRKSSPP